MTLLEAVETGHERVGDLREELDKARVALDRTDAVLAVADDTFSRAEAAITSSRRWGPVVAVVAGVAVVAVVALVVIKRRQATTGFDEDV